MGIKKTIHSIIHLPDRLHYLTFWGIVFSMLVTYSFLGYRGSELEKKNLALRLFLAADTYRNADLDGKEINTLFGRMGCERTTDIYQNVALGSNDVNTTLHWDNITISDIVKSCSYKIEKCEDLESGLKRAEIALTVPPRLAEDYVEKYGRTDL